MASEGDQHQAVAEDLQSAAKRVAEKPGTASEFIQNVAHIVLDKSNQAADSSKTYVETVVHKVQDYAQNAVATGSSGAPNIQETVLRAVHVGGATPAAGNGDATGAPGSDGGLLTSVATWCSSLCGSKSNAAGEAVPRSIDFRAAAENVAQVLHSVGSTTTTTPVASGDAPVAPVAEQPTPKE